MLMIHRLKRWMPSWSLVVPFVACAVLTWMWARPLGGIALAVAAPALIAVVFAAVHHAEVVAHRLGEPYGTLILAMAVTIIEVGLIVSMMVSGGPSASALARDTVFATVMIVCNGVVGLCLLVGALRHHVMTFRVEGSSAALSVLAALTTLTLILPTFTTSTAGPTFSTSQLAFAGIMSLLLFGVFVFVQTVRHRDYFLPIATGVPDDGVHALKPPASAALASLGLLIVALVAVVGLAKSLAPNIAQAVAAMSAPPAVVGIAIALLVLMPETLAAMRAAARNRMQTSLNLALGSALATIGLTIPAVTVVSMTLDYPLQLGLPAKETAQLALTLLISAITLASGRATVLQGAVHLVLFAAFLFLAIVP